MRRALRDVPADQRQALLMHHVEGWSFVEIAARLGIRVNAAKTRAFRGMKKMREHLKMSGAEDESARRDQARPAADAAAVVAATSARWC